MARRILSRWLVAALLAGGFALGPLDAPAESAEAAAGNVSVEVGGLRIRAEGGFVTLEAVEVPHRQILEGLARVLGFELILASPVDERRSLHLERAPWEEALKRAIAPASWAFVYERSSGRSLPSRVFVLPPLGERAVAPSAPPVAATAAPPATAGGAGVAGKGSPLTPDQQQAVGAALAELLTAPDEQTRAIALLGLAGLGATPGIEALRAGVQGEDAWVFELAAELREAIQDDDELRQAVEHALGPLLQRPAR